MSLLSLIHQFGKNQSFTVEIVRDKGGEFSLHDANNMQCSPTFKEDMLDYNDLFSRIIAENPGRLEFLISPTLTRIEGATLLYDKLYKYIHFTDLIGKSRENIRLVNLDYKLAKALVRYLGEKGEDFSHNPAKLLLSGLIENLLFLLRLALLPLFEFFYMTVSRVLIKEPSSKTYDYAIITHYDYRSNAGGRTHEEYFGPLSDHILSKGKSLIVFNRLLHYNNPALFVEYIRQLAASPSAYENAVYDRFLTTLDVFKALLRGLFKNPRLGGRWLLRGLTSHILPVFL